MTPISLEDLANRDLLDWCSPSDRIRELAEQAGIRGAYDLPVSRLARILVIEHADGSLEQA